MLDMPFLRVRQPDHGNRGNVRARRDHRLDIPELQGAVLHFEPRVIVVLGRLAVALDIHGRLREAEDLFAFQNFLFGRVIELGFRGAWRLTRLLRYRQDA